MSAPVPETLRGEEISHLRHELRTPVNQIVGYCELMLEDCSAPQFASRRAPLDSAIASVRDVTSLIDSFLTPTTTVVEKSQILALYQALHAPQLRIIDAMSELLKVSSGSADDTFIADVCRVRDAAERLLPVDRPRAEPTSTFTAPALTVVPSESMGAKPRRSARILVVDDVEENRGVLQRRLEREGHSVLCASSGVEALKMVNEQQVDVILLDVMMPELDGYQTLERLKSSPETREVPVIMISALDDIASIVRCIERGAEDYLPKPFDPVLLRARISASLEKKELREREKEYLRDVMEVAAAAVAVERGGYSSGSLRQVAARSDELGTLARVFDSMMVGIRERESKLRGQIEKLRDEISGVTDTLDGVAEEVELLPLGETFANRYKLKKNVGVGGMGVVYLAEDLELGEQIAIKTLKPELLTSDETAMERFRNEIRLARRIAHRNIVRTHDFGKSDDVYFVTMEFVEGTTLRAVLDKRGCLGAHAVLAIARQLADALKCAHDEGIIHRDIKPQNLLIDQAGTLKVMDFGVARLAQRTSTLTQVGMVVGTPTYMAPEQLLDEEVDPRSDLYSTGVVLYECLTGRPPYEGRSPISLIAKILHEEANAPEALKPDVPHAVSAMVMQLLAKKPAERVQSAGALSEILAGLS